MTARPLYSAATVAAVLSLVAACGGARTATFRDRGLTFDYPRAWSVSGFSPAVLPPRLVVASYDVTPAQVTGDCAGSDALANVPDDGAGLLLIDYGTAFSSSRFQSLPRRLALGEFTRGNYECFGDTYMLRFKAGGHDIQAHLKLGNRASPATIQRALQILDSVESPR